MEEDDIYLPTPAHTEENLCRELLPYKRLLFNLVLYQSNGAKLLLTSVPDNISGLALKKIFIELSILKNHLIFYATSTKSLLKRYVLIYTRTNNVILEKCSLKEAGICHNGKNWIIHMLHKFLFTRLIIIIDEFLLIWRPRKQRRRVYQHENETYLTPTQNDIDQATRNMNVIESELPMYFSREFHAFGVSFVLGEIDVYYFTDSANKSL